MLDLSSTCYNRRWFESDREEEARLKRWIIYIMICISMVLFTACSNGTSSKEDIKLYASSSLTNLLTDMEKEIEKELSINLILHLAPSSQLVSEIEDGGPFDLFLTPNKEHIEMLTELNAIDQQTIATIAMNDIVCINYHNGLEVNCDFSNLDERVQYISVADPDTVT